MTGRSLAYVVVVLFILLSLVAGPLVQPVPALAAAPVTPTNESPSNGATGVSLTPTLRASAFEDGEGDSLADSEWQIAGETLHGSAGDLTACHIPSGLLTYSSTYSWKVRYTDNASETSGLSDEWHFTTVAAPHADFSASSTSAQVNEEISFTNASSGGWGSLSCDWHFGDGSSGSSENPTHSYDAAGFYTVTLTVTDSAGGQDAMTREGYITVSAPAAAPTVTTQAAYGVTTTSATLNGNLANPGTAASVSVSFQWGTSNSYGQTVSAGTMTADGPFSAMLNGLAPGTTYHFRAAAAGDGTVSGSDRSFTTSAAPSEPPAVNTGAASGIATTSATLNLTLTGMGTAVSVQASFEWGPTEEYGYSTRAQAMDDTGSMSYAVGGLAPETTYHFRARVAGDGMDYGADRTFTTAALPDEPPGVVTRAASAIGATSATLNVNVTSLGSAASVQVYFEWGLTAGYGGTTTPRIMSRTGSSSFALSGLSPGTSYHFRAMAAGDGTVQGGDLSFTTSAAPPAPPAVTTGAASGIATTSATLNLTLTGTGTAMSVQASFEWGPTEEYGYSTPAQAMDETGSMSYAVGGLAPETTYHFRAVAVGDGTGYGSDLTFTTGCAPATPPRVKTGDVQAQSAGSVRLSGELTSLGTASSATVSFVWGTSPGGPYLNETPGAVRTEGGTFYIDLDGLDPGTTVYFQAKAVGDGISYGVEKSFTATGTAPRIDSLMAYKGHQGPSLTLKITGSNLSNATQVDLGQGIRVSEFTAVSGAEIRAEVIVESSAKSGGRQVVVTTPSGTAYYTVPAGFLAGVPGDAAAPDDSPRASLWMYLAVVVGGLVVAVLMVPLEVWLWRRLTR